MQIAEKAVYADFLHMKERPEVIPGKLSIPLGEPRHAPDLLKLQEGEHVLLVEPGSFHAQGWIHITELDGVVWYYGILEGEPEEENGNQAYVLYA
jgi:hypothetical protein